MSAHPTVTVTLNVAQGATLEDLRTFLTLAKNAGAEDNYETELDGDELSVTFEP